MMIAAAAMFASCEPDSTTEKPKPSDTSRPFNKVEVFNLGEVDSDGNTHFIIQVSHLNSFNTFTRMMSAYFVAEGSVANHAIPEGDFTLVEGEYNDQGFFEGSFYMELSKDENDIYYHIFTDGNISIEKSSAGYRFVINGEGFDYASGDAVEDVEYVYDGAVTSDAIESTHRYDPDWAGASYMGVYNGVPYWNLQLDDHNKYLLQFFVNTSDKEFTNGIPTFNYEISSSGGVGTVEMSYPVGVSEYWGSLVFRVTEEKMVTENLMIGGYVNIEKVGEVSEEKTLENGTTYRTCDYKIDVKFYNQSYVPYFVRYEGEMKLYDHSAEPEYKPLAQIEYFGDNRYLVKVGHEERESCTQLYTFGPEGSTFEDGLASGQYTVAKYEQTFFEVESGTPYTILAGIYYTNENDKLIIRGNSSFVSPNLEGIGVYDTVDSGTMDVENHGDNNYTISVDLVGGIGYITSFKYTHEGPVTMIDYSDPATPPAEVAGYNSVQPRKYTKEDTFEFNGAVLRR